MYKKIIFPFLALFILSACSVSQENIGNKTEEVYIKSVFITYYELSGFTLNNNEQSFNKLISKAFKNLSDNGFNRVTVHIRPYADAFYPSKYFPSSEYCVGTQGADMPYDSLSIMIDAAHKYNLSFEAWINPYRVSSKNDFTSLSENNIALQWKDTDNLIAIDSGIYFNPASEDVTALIVNGVKEIVENYDVDSICFDDYFYPSKNKKIDEALYQKYKSESGSKSLHEWRRDNVSNMVKSVYSAIKNCNSNVTFGISPASNVENNYSVLYADVEKWASEDGYVDYICPQIYFGFKNENQPFMKTTKSWCSFTDKTLYVALPLYKAGKNDEYAGSSGENEFMENKNIIARQVTYLSKIEKVKGFYIFSYSFLKDNDETNNLYSAMQNS